MIRFVHSLFCFWLLLAGLYLRSKWSNGNKH